MSKKYDTKQLKSLVNLVELCKQSLNLTLARDNKMVCIWHQEKTPSLQIRTNGVHCFGCNHNADHIEFLEQLLNIDFKTAVGILERYVGISCAYQTTQALEERGHKQSLPPPRPHYVPVTSATKTFETCMCDKNYQARVSCIAQACTYSGLQLKRHKSIPADAKEWIKIRGFCEDLFLEYSMNGNVFFIYNARDLNNYVKTNEQNWLASGIFNEHGNLSNASTFHSVFFPQYTLCNGKLIATSLRFRKTSDINNPERKDVALPSTSECPGAFGFLFLPYWYRKYPAQILAGGMQLTALITEGVSDLISAMHFYHNEPNVIVLSTGNIHTISNSHNLKLIENARVILALNNDNTGVKGTEDVAQNMYAAGFKTVEFLPIPRKYGKDINDLLIAFNKMNEQEKQEFQHNVLSLENAQTILRRNKNELDRSDKCGWY